MADSSIHYALLLLPLLWLVGAGGVSLWAVLRNRWLRAQPYPSGSPPAPVLSATPPALPSIEELVSEASAPLSEPPHRGFTIIGVAPPAPGSHAPPPLTQPRPPGTG